MGILHWPKTSSQAHLLDLLPVCAEWRTDEERKKENEEKEERSGNRSVGSKVESCHGGRVPGRARPARLRPL